jgi:hypothetical protein
MCHEEEIEKRVRGTELAAMIHATAPAQRSGVLGSLNMVADAFKLLPPERETDRRWSAYAWSREWRGWLFLTSKPTMRKRLRPLMSLGFILKRIEYPERRGADPEGEPRCRLCFRLEKRAAERRNSSTSASLPGRACNVASIRLGSRDFS